MGPGPGGPGGHWGERGGHGGERGARMFERFDKNGDGRLTVDEVPTPVWEHLKAADLNQDGAITREEIQTARREGKLRPPHGGPGPRDSAVPAE